LRTCDFWTCPPTAADRYPSAGLVLTSSAQPSVQPTACPPSYRASRRGMILPSNVYAWRSVATSPHCTTPSAPPPLPPSITCWRASSRPPRTPPPELPCPFAAANLRAIPQSCVESNDSVVVCACAADAWSTVAVMPDGRKERLLILSSHSSSSSTVRC